MNSRSRSGRTNNYDYKFKVLLVGETRTKQACKFFRYSDEESIGNYMSTLGVDFIDKTINMRGYIIKLQIWDTAGQERFHEMKPRYFGQADGIMFVYDNSNAMSFNTIQKWMCDCNEQKHHRTVKMVFGNKSIQEDKRVVPKEFGEEVASFYDAKFIEASSDSVTNIEKAFLELTEAMLNKKLSKLSSRKVVSRTISYKPATSLEPCKPSGIIVKTKSRCKFQINCQL